MRVVALGLFVCVATFVALIARAISLYPGGTWFDPGARGHDLLRNFLCDLTQPIALNGAVNPGARVAGGAMLVLDLGLLLLWMAIPWLAPSRFARLLRIAGVASFLGIIAVPLTPSLEHGIVHAIAVLSGVVPGIAAGVLANLMLWGSEHPRLYRLGVAILIFSAIDAVLYFHHIVFAGPPVLALPAIQRVALGLLLTWMLAIAITLLRQRVPSRV